MLPVHPFPPIKLARPLLLLGLAAGAAAVALWARRKLKSGAGGQTLIRVEPSEERLQPTVEVPWGAEVPR